LVSLLYPATVLASWEVIGQNDQYEKIYIENKSVRIEGNLRYVRAYLPNIGYADVAVNCYNKSYAIENSEGVRAYEDRAPQGTVIGLLLDEVCGNYVPK
jgi:hypothetical protein